MCDIVYGGHKRRAAAGTGRLLPTTRTACAEVNTIARAMVSWREQNSRITIISYRVEPDSPGAEALPRLASWPMPHFDLGEHTSSRH